MSEEAGEEVTLSCSVEFGNPEELLGVTWYKDGIQIHSRQHQPNAISIPASKQRQAMDHRVFADKANLKITSVYKEDAGVYQCFVQFQNGSNHQATAELRLGGTQYIFTFRGQEFRGGQVDYNE